MLLQFTCGNFSPCGAQQNFRSSMASQFMWLGMMTMMMQWLQSFVWGSCGGFQPVQNPGFGGPGGCGAPGFGGGASCLGGSPVGQLNSQFLGQPYDGGRRYSEPSTCTPTPRVERPTPSLEEIGDGPGRTSGAYGVQTVGGRASMKEGYLYLKDPKSGEVLGRYPFRSGGHGRGAAPWGEYEVSQGRRRSDKGGMMSEGYGYSFNLTQKGMPDGQARDPRFSTNRSLLRIHPDGGGRGTQGCIGIVGGKEVQRDFYEKARQLQDANGGSFQLSFQPAEKKPQEQKPGDRERKHPLSDRAVDMIARSEGFDQPGKWPGASSGITIGVGYDLGYMTKDQFRKDWGDKLPPDQLRRLESVIGVKGSAAKNMAHRFRDIEVPKEQALDVFHNSTLPRYYEQAKKAFPGMERLPSDAQGALTSLVFNRGTSMSGDRRREMRNIRGMVSNYGGQSSLDSMANQIRSMKRLWAGKGLGGLLTRRDNEAELLRRSLHS